MEIKFKNSKLQGFIEFLFDIELRGKESRMRTRFLSLLQERYQLIMQEVETIQRENAELDEYGEIIYNLTKMPDGEEAQSFKVKDIKKYNQEIGELMNELFIIDVDRERREMISSVKKSVLDYDSEIGGQLASTYDHLCEVLESVTL